MNQRQTDVLRALAIRPRSAKYFVSEQTMPPSAADLYLGDLVLRGYAIEPEKIDYAYQITEEGLAYLASLPQDVVPSRIVCNASMPPGSYVPKPWLVRAGGDDHRRHQSKGLGA